MLLLSNFMQPEEYTLLVIPALGLCHDSDSDAVAVLRPQIPLLCFWLKTQNCYLSRVYLQLGPSWLGHDAPS